MINEVIRMIHRHCIELGPVIDLAVRSFRIDFRSLLIQ